MKWLRWRTNHASHHSPWYWEPIPDDYDDVAARDVAVELAAAAFGGERAPSYAIVDVAPPWVVNLAIERAKRGIEALKVRLVELRSMNTQACAQCDQATAWPLGQSDIWYKRSGQPEPTEHRINCPTCGRDVIEETLTPGILRTDEREEITLLRKLTDGPIQGRCGERLRWPVENEAAYHRLVELGLAGGCVSGNKVEIEISAKGRREARRHG